MSHNFILIKSKMFKTNLIFLQIIVSTFSFETIVHSNQTITNDLKTLEKTDIEHDILLRNGIKLKLLLSQSTYQEGVVSLFLFVDDNDDKKFIESLNVYNHTVFEQITASQSYIFKEIVCEKNLFLKFDFNYIEDSFFIYIKFDNNLNKLKLLHIFYKKYQS